jgi:hypothetical protein
MPEDCSYAVGSRIKAVLEIIKSGSEATKRNAIVPNQNQANHPGV